MPIEMSIARPWATAANIAEGLLGLVYPRVCALCSLHRAEVMDAASIIPWEGDACATLGGIERVYVKAIASAGQSQFSLAPERPNIQLLRSLKEQGGQRAVASIEGLDDAGDVPAD